jgi:UDP-glucose:(heptosyl)LPS alpha-1,3-glucosyltransferase
VGRDRHPARYVALARRLGVTQRVTFAGPQTDPRPFYGAADAFVLPSLYDALSNAVLEALACGLPVVTSDRCGAGELVKAHDAGVVCGARDIGALAAAMTTLLSAPARRARAATRSPPWPSSRRRRWRRASFRSMRELLGGAALYSPALPPH